MDPMTSMPSGEEEVVNQDQHDIAEREKDNVSTFEKDEEVADGSLPNVPGDSESTSVAVHLPNNQDQSTSMEPHSDLREEFSEPKDIIENDASLNTDSNLPQEIASNYASTETKDQVQSLAMDHSHAKIILQNKGTDHTGTCAANDEEATSKINQEIRQDVSKNDDIHDECQEEIKRPQSPDGLKTDMDEVVATTITDEMDMSVEIHHHGSGSATASTDAIENNSHVITAAAVSNDVESTDIEQETPKFTAPTSSALQAQEKSRPVAKTSSSSLQFEFQKSPKSNQASSTASFNTYYTQEKWMAEESTRRLIFCGQVSVLEKGKYFWSQDQFVPKTLALFEHPHLLVISKPSLQGDTFTNANVLQVERVVDLQTCKLRLSTLTTPTSMKDICRNELTGLNDISNMTLSSPKSAAIGTSGNVNYRSLSCFEILTPSENISISAMKHGDNSKITFAATVRWESEVAQAILSAHGIDTGDEQEAHSVGGCVNVDWDHFKSAGSNNSELKITNSHSKTQGLSLEIKSAQVPQKVSIAPDADLTIWRHRHQLILGTLHSHVVTGNSVLLKQFLSPRGSPLEPFPNIDQRDGAGLTPLHYACYKRSHTLVSTLLNAGADCSLPTLRPFLGKNTPCHISASLLDEKSLSVLLSCSKPCRADPNALNEDGDTPMAVALNAGVCTSASAGVLALDPIDSSLGSGVGSRTMCVDALRAWGGQLSLQKTQQPARSSRNGLFGIKNPLQNTRENEESSKNKLFGNIGKAMKNLFTDEEGVLEKELSRDIASSNSKIVNSRSGSERSGSKSLDGNNQVSGLMGSLSATRNAFNERGEKLNTLSEKTGALRDASEDFAKMAEELCKSQEKGIFGLW